MAQADLGGIAGRLAAAYPRSNEGRGVQLVELRSSLVGDLRPGLLVLLSAAVVVLLVVCANVAGLLLTRALAGTRDLAIRSALGAARGRLVRGALVESALLATAGGLAGLGVAWLAARRIAAVDDSLAIPLIDQTRLDPSVIGVAMAAAAVVGAVLRGGAGVAGLGAGRPGRTGAGRRQRDPGPRRGRGRWSSPRSRMAVVLVIGAFTLVRSFARLVAMDVGFDTADTHPDFALSLPEVRYDTPATPGPVRRSPAGPRPRSCPGSNGAGRCWDCRSPGSATGSRSTSATACASRTRRRRWCCSTSGW